MSSFLSSSSLGKTNVIRKTTSAFHGYAIVDREDIANAMEMLERSQDEQGQRLESRKQRGRCRTTLAYRKVRINPSIHTAGKL
jgi:hypothetical protein